MQKTKVVYMVLLLASLVVYMEWGTDSHMFLLQAEAEVLYRLFTSPLSAAHPFTLIPLLGQVILLICVFKKEPPRYLLITGIACVGLLVLFVLLTGILSGNFKTIASALPFVGLAIYSIVNSRIKPPPHSL